MKMADRYELRDSTHTLVDLQECSCLLLHLICEQGRMLSSPAQPSTFIISHALQVLFYDSKSNNFRNEGLDLVHAAPIFHIASSQEHNEDHIEPLADEPACSLTDASEQPFAYDHLPGHRYLRLLELHPGHWDDPIRCSLSTVELDTLGESNLYEAVSYAWGDPAKRQSIICNNHSFPITRSLFEALQMLRPLEGESSRVLWADGISINQDDVDERSQQVQIMGHIYAKATGVVAWLGHEDPQIVVSGLDLVCQIASKGWDEARNGISYIIKTASSPRNWENSTYNWRGDKASKSTTRHASRETSDSVELHALEPLFRCQWFRRLWVVQEIVLSRTVVVYWGHGSIDHDLLGLAATYAISREVATYIHEKAMTAFINCLTTHSMWIEKSIKHPFLTNLTHARHFEASDPRDKIYGFLGLTMKDSDPTRSLFVNPDYNFSKVEVYTVVAEKIVIEGNDVDLLSAAQHGQQLVNDWPSWVPDWSQPWTSILSKHDRRTSLDTLPVITKPFYTFCKQIIHKDAVVSVRGIPVSHVQHLAVNITDGFWAWSDANVLRAVQKFLLNIQPYHSDETVAFTASAGHGHDLYFFPDLTPSRISDHVADYHAFLTWDLEQYSSSNNTVPPLSEADGIDVRNAYRFYTNAQPKIIRRRFFFTVNGDVGLGPAAMQEGDIVVVLFGGKMPYILRPYGDGQHFRLFGEAYVHAIMDGQAIEKWRESGEPAVNFHLY